MIRRTLIAVALCCLSASHAYAVSATGGTITNYTDAGGTNWTAHIFTSTVWSNSVTTNFSVTVASAGDWVEVLVVAGGGGGGVGDGGSDGGGGGGAGGLIYTNLSVVVSNYPVTVGRGGAGGTSTFSAKGTNSVFATLTALGGGGVRRTTGDTQTQDDGGSGGGAFGRSQTDFTPGTGTQTNSASGGYGNDGGPGVRAGGPGGGGGGAGGVGGTPGDTTKGGEGGIGLTYGISGVSIGYAGGGGGGPDGAGGGASTATHGGGAGGNPGTSGTPNTGGGGGGSSGAPGGNGGSGIVIVRYVAGGAVASPSRYFYRPNQLMQPNRAIKNQETAL